MAILTNNVREWEELWRTKLPVDEIFELIVDSAWVGMRKPDPAIYRLTIERLGGLAPEQRLFVDDNELNVEAARELGMTRRALPLERAGDPGDQGRRWASRQANGRRALGISKAASPPACRESAYGCLLMSKLRRLRRPHVRESAYGCLPDVPDSFAARVCSPITRIGNDGTRAQL